MGWYIIQQEEHETILIMAARRGMQEIVDMLLVAGADIEAKNKVS